MWYIGIGKVSAMSASSFTLEDDVEQQAIDWLVEQGYLDMRATSNGGSNE